MKKYLFKHLFSCVLILGNYHSFAQNTAVIDSLKNLLSKAEGKTTIHDTTRINTLNALAWELKYNKPETALKYAQQSLKLAEKSAHQKGIANAFHSIGSIKDIIGDYPTALKYYNKALIIREQLNDKKGISASLGNIGIVYWHQGDYPKALEYYFKVLKAFEELENKEGIAKILGNIGLVYHNQGDYPKALEYYFKALKMDEELSNKNGIARHLGNIGVIYKGQGDYPKALEYYFKALKMRQELRAKNLIASTLGNIGGVYDEQAERKRSSDKVGSDSLYNKALEYYFKALKMSEELGNKSRIAAILGNIGALYTEQKKYPEAERYLLQALELCDSIGALNYKMHFENSISELYTKTRQYQNAYEHHIEYSIAKDSLFNEEKSKEIGKLEAGYEYEIKMQEQRLVQEKQSAVAVADSRRQKVIIYAVSGGLLLVVMFFILLFNRFRIKQKANIQLAKKNRQITDSIDYAQRIQNAVLPPLDLVKTYFPDSFVLLKPKDIVSGDFFWLHQQNGKIMFAAADCTGHGVPGAFMSIIGNNILNHIATTNIATEPAEILNQLSKQLISRLKQKGKEGGVTDGMDIALCTFEHTGKGIATFQYAGAHNPLYIISNSQLKEFKGDKLFIGITGATSDSNFTNHTIQLKKGDCIYIFSDGYADQKGGPKGKKFYYPTFQQLLVDIHQKSMKEQKEILNKTIEDWKGDREQIDDMLVVGIRV